MQCQALLVFLLAVFAELTAAQNFSNQTVAQNVTYSGIVFALSATGVVALLMVIVALTGGLIVAKMASKKDERLPANGF